MKASFRRCGSTLTEIIVVLAVLAILVGTAFVSVGRLRKSARDQVVVRNLKQIGSSMELYFNDYRRYPPLGVPLPQALAKYIENDNMFDNPYFSNRDIYTEGYHGPTKRPFDKLISIIPPETTHEVALYAYSGVQTTKLQDATSPEDMAFDDDGEVVEPDAVEGPVVPELNSLMPFLAVSGSVNLNPNNNDDMEFRMVLPDGTVIDRDALHENQPEYEGMAVSVLFHPKGNGNQNTMVVRGAPFSVVNASEYHVVSNTMNVRLWNDKRNTLGKALGQWWISISLYTGKITVDGVPYTLGY